MSNKHYMEKDGVIKVIPINEWARYRRAGYAFSSLEAFNKQQSGAAPDRDDAVAEVPTMDNKKSEIVEYLVAQGFEVDGNATKAELLEAVDQG